MQVCNFNIIKLGARLAQWCNAGLQAGWSGVESHGLGIFLFTTPPIQWVPVALSLGVKRLGHEADHSTPSCSEVKYEWSYTSTPPIYLYGMVLN